MDSIKKILKNTLPLLLLVVFIFWNKGIQGGAIWLTSMLVILLICWAFWRVLTGSWDIKKYSETSLKMETSAFKERKNSFVKLFIKLLVIVMVSVVGFLWLFVIMGKRYFQ